jgi:hypothetical protein
VVVKFGRIAGDAIVCMLPDGLTIIPKLPYGFTRDENYQRKENFMTINDSGKWRFYG